MKRLINAWRRRPIITTAFLIATVFTIMFAVRSATMMIYWSDPDHRDQTIEGWMTPRYVARSWNLPADIMVGAIGGDQMPDPRRPLHEIAAEQGIALQELTTRITNAAATFREQQ